MLSATAIARGSPFTAVLEQQVQAADTAGQHQQVAQPGNRQIEHAIHERIKNRSGNKSNATPIEQFLRS